MRKRISSLGRKEIGSDIQVVQWRWPIGKPLVDGFGDGLMRRRKHIGSTLDLLFEELGENDDVGLLTQKKLLAAKVERAMAERDMSKAALARAMNTSRTVVHRLLDPKDTGVTLATIWKASKALDVVLVELE